MAVPAKEELLCPRCKVPMVQAVGVPGVWQCPNRQDHEFMEDSPLESKARSKKSTEPASKPPPQPAAPPRCPSCGARTKQDDLGRYCDSDVHRGIYRLPTDDEPYWLSHLGLKAPLQSIRQSSNVLDGTMCQGVGDIKHGGGGSSGRKRKKPPKRVRGSKDFYEV